jgi:hypothetical protein
LGYFLKTGAYRAEDWDWLLTKITKRIELWCNRWLSLGGRYTLVKNVLEGQPVYWMSMEAIPRSVLKKIKKLMFKFLWNGNKDTHKNPPLQMGFTLKTKKEWGLGS